MTVKLQSDEGIPDMRPLTFEDVEHLRLGWWSKLDTAEVNRMLIRAPGLSVWMPSTSEYVLVSPWRHRSDIVHVMELVSIRNPVDLTMRAVSEARKNGIRMFLAVEMSERRQQSFYDRVGMTPLEDVLSYELVPRTTELEPDRELNLRRVHELDVESMAALTEIDWQAFPWLWRNSEAEFRDYAAQTGVELHILRHGDQNVGYIGITCFPGWGHVDRVAVVPDLQGQGLGTALTQAAIRRLRTLGATRIGLSTQRRNQRSQRLYARLGFRRQETGDYRIFGLALKPDDDLDYLVTGGEQ